MRVDSLKNYKYFTDKRCAKNDIFAKPYTFDRVTFGSANSKDISNLHKTFNNVVKVIFSDIDGTISHGARIPAGTYQGIESIRQANIPLILTTGRSYQEVLPLVKELNLNPDYIIVEQGAAIVDSSGEPVYENLISKKDVEDVVSLADDYKKVDPGIELVLYIDGQAYARNPVFIPEHPQVSVKTVGSFDELLSNGSVTKGVIVKFDSAGYEDLEGISACFDEKFGDKLHKFTTAKCFYEFTNNGVSKGSAIEAFCEKKNIKLKNVACIGDAGNDIEMAKTVSANDGLSICMGNGIDKMKEVSRYITSSIDENGFVQAINYILANNKRLSRLSGNSNNN